MCRIVPVARGLFHIDTEAEGRGCLWGINAVHKGAIQHNAWYIHSKLRINPQRAPFILQYTRTCEHKL